MVIAFGNAVVADVECLTHGDKRRFEFAVIIHNNKAAEADFQWEGFHEESGWCFSGGVCWVFTDDETGEVAHGNQWVG